MRVVVTEGSGRLGQFVVRELFTRAHQVSAIDAVKPRACRLALEADFSGHQAFNICAAHSIMDLPIGELIERFLSQVKAVRQAAGC